MWTPRSAPWAVFFAINVVWDLTRIVQGRDGPWWWFLAVESGFLVYWLLPERA